MKLLPNVDSPGLLLWLVLVAAAMVASACVARELMDFLRLR